MAIKNNFALIFYMKFVNEKLKSKEKAMKKLTRIICMMVATVVLFAMGGCNEVLMKDFESYYLQIGSNEIEYENQDCATVNFMITDNNAISNVIPNGSSLDGFKPCRVDIENPNRIISDWTDAKGSTVPFSGTASDGLTLYPIWSDCTVYSDRTPIGYWDVGGNTSSTHKDWTNQQADQWTTYENNPKYYKFQLKDSNCILIDFSEGYKDTDVIEMTVEMSVNKLYLIGVEEKTFETKIKINARSTELHIYMDNMLMKSRNGAPVIDTSNVNFEVVTIEAAGNCSLTGRNSSAIFGDIIAITGRNGTYTIIGGDNSGDKTYSGIDCNRVNINNTKVTVKGGNGINGSQGAWNGDNTDGGPGGNGGAGGNAITVNNQIELFKCTLNLNGGTGGNGGNGGPGDNAALTKRNGGNGGNGGAGGNMLNFTNNVVIKLNRDDVVINGAGGSGGVGGTGGEGGGYENSWKKGDKGADGAAGKTGLSAKLIKKVEKKQVDKEGNII